MGSNESKAITQSVASGRRGPGSPKSPNPRRLPRYSLDGIPVQSLPKDQTGAVVAQNVSTASTEIDSIRHLCKIKPKYSPLLNLNLTDIDEHFRSLISEAAKEMVFMQEDISRYRSQERVRTSSPIGVRTNTTASKSNRNQQVLEKPTAENPDTNMDIRSKLFDRVKRMYAKIADCIIYDIRPLIASDKPDVGEAQQFELVIQYMLKIVTLVMKEKADIIDSTIKQYENVMKPNTTAFVRKKDSVIAKTVTQIEQSIREDDPSSLANVHRRATLLGNDLRTYLLLQALDKPDAIYNCHSDIWSSLFSEKLSLLPQVKSFVMLCSTFAWNLACSIDPISLVTEPDQYSQDLHDTYRSTGSTEGSAIQYYVMPIIYCQQQRSRLLIHKGIVKLYDK